MIAILVVEKILQQAILKEGIDNFSCIILDSKNGVPTICESEEELNASEAYYIDLYDCVNSHEYYNLKVGGEGKSASGDNRIGIHKGNEMHFVQKEDLKQWFDKGFQLGGKPQSQEVVMRRAASNTGKKRNSETREKISKSQLGKKHSAETIAKLKAIHSGQTAPNKGKIRMHCDSSGETVTVDKEQEQYYLNLGFRRGTNGHSEESKKNHSNAMKDRIYVCNSDGVVKHPPKSELNDYLNKGWVVGKKYKL